MKKFGECIKLLSVVALSAYVTFSAPVQAEGIELFDAIMQEPKPAKQDPAPTPTPAPAAKKKCTLNCYFKDAAGNPQPQVPGATKPKGGSLVACHNWGVGSPTECVMNANSCDAVGKTMCLSPACDSVDVKNSQGGSSTLSKPNC